MWIYADDVTFDEQDMHFVKKFGIPEATQMVLDYKSLHHTPFIYDTYQLAHWLEIPRSALFPILDDIPRYYKRSYIPKKSGGKREINEPLYPLKQLQERILRDILCWMPCSAYARAYTRGSQLYRNASPHVGHKYLLKMDITDFFGSTRFDRILAEVFRTELFPKEIGAMLTSLCTLEDVLPQGACTSPAISNLVMKFFDDNFGRWCNCHGLAYTRYSDDITISGDTSLYPAFMRAKEWLGDMGYEINEKKTHFITNASRQTVTGLTVNEKVSVPRDYKRRLRQELYYVLTYGFENVLGRLRSQGVTDYADMQQYHSVLMGKINFILSVEPDNPSFIRMKDALREQFEREF